MQINNFSSVQNFLLNKNLTTQNSTNSTIPNIYKSDSLSVANYQSEPGIIPKEPYDPVPPSEPKFFDNATVRLAGMSLAMGAVGGGIGAGISKLVGAASISRGVAIGATVGILAPVALLAYGLYSWNKNSSSTEPK